MAYRNLYILFTLSAFLVFSALLGNFFYPYKAIQSARNSTVKLTGFDDMALNVFWYETRLLRFENIHYDPYPQAPSIDTLRFVYKHNTKGNNAD